MLPITTKAVRTALLEYNRKHYDLYFCPNPFLASRRLARNALQTRYAWADIDDANPEKFEPQPNILWSTSPGRHQGLWLWGETLEPTDAEAVSRYLAYKFGADKSGWDINQVLRVPHTSNHKYADVPKVRLLRSKFAPQPKPKFDPPQLGTKRRTHKKSFSFNVVQSDEAMRRRAISILERHKKTLKPIVKIMLANLRNPKSMHVHRFSDRSAMIYRRIGSLLKSRLNENEIFTVMWLDPYFRGKHGPNKNALAAEVSRCIEKHQSGSEEQ
tara:strand:- start:40477 stop:41289 length:813 start_codon:yes stop_codon:yes gene_type:complete